MSTKSPKVTNYRQFSTLVEELTKRPEMAKGLPMFGTNRQQFKDDWKDICRKLNECGPPMRGIEEWKKVWSDLKSRTKKKMRDNALELERLSEGVGVGCFCRLTPMEQEVEKILNLVTARNFPMEATAETLAAKHLRVELSCNKPPSLFATSMHDTCSLPPDNFPAFTSSQEPSLALPDPTPSPKRRKLQDEFLTHLQEQMETQKAVLGKLDKLDNISTSLESMANSLQTIANSLERLSKGFEQLTSFATVWSEN